MIVLALSKIFFLHDKRYEGVIYIKDSPDDFILVCSDKSYKIPKDSFTLSIE